MEAEWDAPRHRPRDEAAAPVLSTDGFEGPLDWLVELARARRIDLQRVSVLALIEAFEAALLQALDGTVSAATLARWGDWLVLAAELTLLRSRLMLRAEADAGTAREEAEALRQRLIGRAEMAAAGAWLGQRTQLGLEVFERGAPETARSAGRGRVGDITTLLRACLVALAVPEDAAAAFRVVAPYWSVTDAVGRMRRWLAAATEAEIGLEVFLPSVAADASERERRCRVAVASTFLGSLELAREGVVTLTQESSMGSIQVRAHTASAAVEP